MRKKTAKAELLNMEVQMYTHTLNTDVAIIISADTEHMFEGIHVQKLILQL